MFKRSKISNNANNMNKDILHSLDLQGKMTDWTAPVSISFLISYFCFSDKIRYLTMTDATKVWMPDTFFRNEKIGRFHNILQANLYVRVFPNGDVLYSIRVSLTCACSMHLALFPLDKQTCNLDVASCEYSMSKVGRYIN